jgi:hypothetical protein
MTMLVDAVADNAEGLKKAVFYGWVPFVLAVGYFMTNPRPSLVQIVSPL